MSDESEISKSEKAAWLAMQPAEDERDFLRTDLAVAQGRLDGACERSSDPAVRGAYEGVRVLKEMLRRLSE